MKIERLLFQVSPPEFSKDFLQADAEVWNSWLQRQSGFINKTNRTLNQGLVEILIYWRSDKDLQKAASKEKEIKFVNNLLKKRSPGTFRLVHSSTF